MLARLQAHGLRASLIALPLLAAPAAASVYTVDMTGFAANFSHPQTAIDAASDGDTLIFLGNDEGIPFPTFTIAGKGLTLIGEPEVVAEVAHPPLIIGDVTIRDLLPSQTVVLQDLHIRALIQLFLLPEPLIVRDCAGHVVLDGVLLDRTNAHAPVMLTVTNSSAVTLIDCDVRGSDSMQTNVAGDAVLATGSNLYVYESELRGGVGQNGVLDGIGIVPPSPGGNALLLFGGSALISGSVVAGGNGGTGVVDVFGACHDSRDGGDGLVLSSDGDTDASATVIGSAPTGGTGGGPFDPFCGVGSDGVGIDPGTGTLTQVTKPSRAGSVSSPVREGETAQLAFQGEPGDIVLLLYGSGATPASFPFWSGALYPDPLLNFFVAGTADGSGALAFGIPVGEIGVQAAQLTLQGLFVPASLIEGDVVLGNPMLLVLLDSSL